MGVAGSIPSLLADAAIGRTPVNANVPPTWSDRVLSQANLRVTAFVSAAVVDRLVRAEHPEAQQIAIRQLGHWAAQVALWNVDMHMVQGGGQEVLGNRSFVGWYTASRTLPDGLWREDEDTGEYRLHRDRNTLEAYERDIKQLDTGKGRLILSCMETNRWLREAALAIGARRWDDFIETYDQVTDDGPQYPAQGMQKNRIPMQRLPTDLG